MSTTTPPRGEQLRTALLHAGVAEVEISARRRAEYSSDASLYRVPPTAVVFPRSRDDIEATLQVCRDLGVALTSRGSGTSIAGNAVGTGVVLDVRRHLATIHNIDPEARTATVDPGVVLDDLQRAAAPHGLRFGPDPSTHDRCTLGGMIGNNACGSRALGYGRTVDNVLELDVLAGTGERLTAGQDTRAEGSALAAAALDVANAHRSTIVAEFDRFSRQVSGYGLHHLLPENGSHLARALVGSEGTCAVTLRAKLALVPDPPESVLVVLGYPDMATAADAVPPLLPHGASAMEGLDARIVEVVRQRRGDAAVPDLPPGGGWLFVEVAGEERGDVDRRAAAIIADADALGHRIVSDPTETRALWRIREDGSGLVARSGVRPAHAGWEDAAVPPERLGGYLREFESLLGSHGLTGVPYGHFGDGCVHVRIDFPLGEPDGTAAFRAFLSDAARLVAAHGGSISGEHGDGRARSELLRAMYSDAAIDAFAAFKAVCDPDDVLNPGIIVRPRPLDADLRAERPAMVTAPSAFGFPEDGGSLASAVHRCTGIGRCVRPDPATGTVMCPSYLATGDEKDSTRGRARVLQEMVEGTFAAGVRAPEVHESLDLCLACKGCSSDCPTGTDVAAYKAEVLHQTYRRRLRPRSHYTLGWLPRWARLAARMPRVVSGLLGFGPFARVAKALAGVDPRRPIPAFTPHNFRRWFVRHQRSTGVSSDASSGRPVVLWLDTFTERFTPQVAVAAVRVLEDAGFTVQISSPGDCCALTWISTGQLDGARRILRRTVDDLADSARAGIPIVGLEPSCTAVLRSDALELLGHDDPAAQAVAAATRTLAELLASVRPGWQPPSLDGTEVVAQPHCHHHAVLGWAADQALLRSAGASVQTLGGCCGLAGNFGMEKGHHDVSVAVAETALLPAVRAASRDAVVLADGFSCRVQLQHLSAHRGMHLAELLAARLSPPRSSPSPSSGSPQP